MKEKLRISNYKKTEHVFQQLDKCISEARKAEQTNDWKEAWQEAGKLGSLTNFSCAIQIVVNSAAILSGAYQQNWILVMVSAATIFNCIVILHEGRHK